MGNIIMSNQDNEDSNDKKPEVKVVFMDGCFDEFEGTQEELDELVAQITNLAKNGKLVESFVSLDEDLDQKEAVVKALERFESNLNQVSETYGRDDNGFIKYPFPNTRH